MRRSRYWLYGGWVLTALLALVILALIVGNWTNACTLPVLLDQAQKPVTWCWEFWFNRYQTLFAALATLGGGFLAFLAVRRQTEVGRASEYRNTLAELRELAIEAHAIDALFFRIANVRGLSLPITTATSSGDIQSITETYRADWEAARSRMRLLLSRFYKLLLTHRMAKSVGAFSRAFYDVDNFASIMVQKLSHANVYGSLVNQQSYIQGMISRAAQQGDSSGHALMQASAEMVEALKYEAESVEAELVRIAPPPGEHR